MPPPVMTNVQKLAALTQLSAVGGPLHTNKVGLFMNNFTPGVGSVLADLTPPTYTGYAVQSNGAWGAPYINTSGKAQLTSPGLQFQPTDDATPNTIYGWYLADTAGTVLIQATRFDTPVNLVTSEQAIVFQPFAPYGA